MIRTWLEKRGWKVFGPSDVTLDKTAWIKGSVVTCGTLDALFLESEALEDESKELRTAHNAQVVKYIDLAEQHEKLTAERDRLREALLKIQDCVAIPSHGTVRAVYNLAVKALSAPPVEPSTDVETQPDSIPPKRTFSANVTYSLTGRGKPNPVDAEAPPMEEMELRRLLWLRHGCPLHALYGDDGEMQCSACVLDFKRATSEKIYDRFMDAGVKAFLDSLPLSAPRPQASQCTCQDIDGMGWFVEPECPVHGEQATEGEGKS